MRQFAPAKALCALLLLAGCGEAQAGGGSIVPPEVDQSASVDFAQTSGPIVPLQGFLISYPSDLTELGRQRATALRPRFWRGGDAGGLGQVAQLWPDVKLVFVVSDPFLWEHGGSVLVDPACDPSTGCFASYDALNLAWTQYVQTLASAAAVSVRKPDYWDLMNEPDGFWQGLSGSQKLELLRVAHDAIRAKIPDAVIVAPSLGEYVAESYEVFLSHAAQNDLRYDAVSWHELVRPEKIEGFAADLRTKISAAYAAKPALAPRELHVNEWIGGHNHLVPGITLGFLTALEKAKVDLAVRACWYPSAEKRPEESECGAGLNGLFMPDGETPRANYWVHRAYAELGTTRATVTTTEPGLVALAGEADGKRRILIGRSSCGASGKWCIWQEFPAEESPLPSIAVGVELVGTSADVEATVQRFPHAGNAALPEVDIPSNTVRATLRAGVATIVLEDFADGDVYSISF